MLHRIARQLDRASRPYPLILGVRWLVVCALGVCAWTSATAPPDTEVPIAVKPQDGCNLVLVDQVSPTYAILRLQPPNHGWFAGTLTNLPTGVPATLGLSMAGNDHGQLPADVGKWQGLRPLMTYGDPTKADTYEWFVKEADGRWVSGDPVKTGDARYAGTGVVPEQSVMPHDIATSFLDREGAFWSPWREIDAVEVLTNVNIFRMRQVFALPEATVAMRVPFTYTYLQTLIEKVRIADVPGVSIDDIGMTPEGRHLQIIRLTDPNEAHANQHTILVAAREHATEPVGSWVIQGMLQSLLSEDGTPLRAHRTWLFICILDPDGSADAVHDRLTERFCKSNTPPTPVEVQQYARYITDYIADGGQIDLAVTLHNVEATECANIFTPIVNPLTKTLVHDLNTDLFTRLQERGFVTEDPTRHWYMGLLTMRFTAWCSLRFGALELTYELNDRYPDHRLTLQEQTEMGQILANQLAVWQESDIGQQWHQDVTTRLEAHRQKRRAFYTERHRDPTRRTLHEMLNLGY